MIRFIIISLILLSLNGCSGKDKTEIIKTEIKKDEPQGKDLTKQIKKKKKFILSSEKKFKEELNPNLKVEIESKLFKNNDYSNLTNNGRRIDFDSNLESKKKYIAFAPRLDPPIPKILTFCLLCLPTSL